MSRCHYCGETVDADARLCGNCGARQAGRQLQWLWPVLGCIGAVCFTAVLLVLGAYAACAPMNF